MCSRNSTYGFGAEMLYAAVEDSTVARLHRHILNFRLDEQCLFIASPMSLQCTSGDVTWRKLFHRQSCYICEIKQQYNQLLGEPEYVAF